MTSLGMRTIGNLAASIMVLLGSALSLDLQFPCAQVFIGRFGPHTWVTGSSANILFESFVSWGPWALAWPCLVVHENVDTLEEFKRIAAMVQTLKISHRSLVSLQPRNTSQLEHDVHRSFTWIVSDRVLSTTESLAGLHLKGAYMKSWPHLSDIGHGGTNKEYTNTLANQLSFKYTLQEVTSYKRVKNGQESGLIPEVSAKKYDFGLGEPMITSDRDQEVDFSTYTYIWELGFRTLRPQPKDSSGALIQVFDQGSWALLLAAMIMVALLLTCMDHLSKNHLDIFDIWSVAFASPLQESFPDRLFRVNEFRSRYMILYIWLLMGNVLAMAYRSSLLAALVSDEYEAPLSTAEEILASGLKIYAFDGALLSQALKTSSREVFRDIYQERIVDQGGLYGPLFPLTPEMDQELLAGTALLSTTRTDTNRLANFMFVEDAFFTGFTGLVAPEGSQLLSLFNPIFLRLHAAGILSKWENDYIVQSLRTSAFEEIAEAGPESQTSKDRPLLLSELSVTLYGFLVCSGISISAFLLETIFHQLSKNQNINS